MLPSWCLLPFLWTSLAFSRDAELTPLPLFLSRGHIRVPVSSFGPQKRRSAAPFALIHGGLVREAEYAQSSDKPEPLLQEGQDRCAGRGSCEECVQNEGCGWCDMSGSCALSESKPTRGDNSCRLGSGTSCVYLQGESRTATDINAVATDPAKLNPAHALTQTTELQQPSQPLDYALDMQRVAAVLDAVRSAEQDAIPGENLLTEVKRLKLALAADAQAEIESLGVAQKNIADAIIADTAQRTR